MLGIVESFNSYGYIQRRCTPETIQANLMHTTKWMSLLAAYNLSIVNTKSSITDCSPGIVDANFHPSLQWINSVAIHQSNVKLCAADISR
jgi:hypothetical protein